jgi:hypothetical protein
MQAAVARTSDKNLTLPAQVPELHLECRGKGQRDAEQDGNLLQQYPGFSSRPKGTIDKGPIDVDGVESSKDCRNDATNHQCENN